jgi:hypothetical protein
MSRESFRGFQAPAARGVDPFGALLDQLAAGAESAGEAAPHRRPAPDFTWTGGNDPAEAAAPRAAVNSAYNDADASAVNDDPRSLEEAVALELQLEAIHEPADLERVRRRFAFRHHPDRVDPLHRQEALRRMTVANVLVDKALKSARARSRGA